MAIIGSRAGGIDIAILASQNDQYARDGGGRRLQELLDAVGLGKRQGTSTSTNTNLYPQVPGKRHRGQGQRGLTLAGGRNLPGVGDLATRQLIQQKPQPPRGFPYDSPGAKPKPKPNTSSSLYDEVMNPKPRPVPNAPWEGPLVGPIPLFPTRPFVPPIEWNWGSIPVTQSDWFASPPKPLPPWKPVDKPSGWSHTVPSPPNSKPLPKPQWADMAEVPWWSFLGGPPPVLQQESYPHLKPAKPWPPVNVHPDRPLYWWQIQAGKIPGARPWWENADVPLPPPTNPNSPLLPPPHNPYAPSSKPYNPYQDPFQNPFQTPPRREGNRQRSNLFPQVPGVRHRGQGQPGLSASGSGIGRSGGGRASNLFPQLPGQRHRGVGQRGLSSTNQGQSQSQGGSGTSRSRGGRASNLFPQLPNARHRGVGRQGLNATGSSGQVGRDGGGRAITPGGTSGGSWDTPNPYKPSHKPYNPYNEIIPGGTSGGDYTPGDWVQEVPQRPLWGLWGLNPPWIKPYIDGTNWLMGLPESGGPPTNPHKPGSLDWLQWMEDHGPNATKPPPFTPREGPFPDQPGITPRRLPRVHPQPPTGWAPWAFGAAFLGLAAYTWWQQNQQNKPQGPVWYPRPKPMKIPPPPQRPELLFGDEEDGPGPLPFPPPRQIPLTNPPRR